MSKKKLTNKEITETVGIIDKNTQHLYNLILQLNSRIDLYLEFSKDTDKFNKFVKAKVEEFEQQRSENKKGA